MDLIERGRSDARHPWELARFRFVRRALERGGLLSDASALLDIGSGDAWLAAQLRGELNPAARVVCWDANYSAGDRASLALAHPRIEFAAERPSGRFDLLLLLDVLEHVEDDRGFLAGIVDGVAASGAHALVTVPAWQAVFSRRDTALGHYRRYSTSSARALLQSAGLRIVEDGGLFHSLLPMRAAAVALGRMRGATDGAGVNPIAWSRGPAVTRALTGVLAAEARVSLALARLRVNLPGLSYWALCRHD